MLWMLHSTILTMPETKYNPEEVLDAIFWIAARSEHPADYNVHIYNLLAELNA